MPENRSTSPGRRPGSDLHLDLSAAGGLRDSLMASLREAVRTGRLAPGTWLPSSRSLATDLGLARNTVTAAYTELVAEGWLVARRGSGTRVAERAGPPGGRRTSSPAPAAPPPAAPHALRPGNPAADSFPRAAWTRAARRALTAAPNDAFGPGDPRGRRELRQALAEHLARARGVHTDPEHVVVCAGFAHGLALVAAALREDAAGRPDRPGVVAVEDHGLPSHRAVLANSGLALPALATDGHGARIADLPGTGAGAVLLTAAHQFPTGGALQPRRRTAVIDWARRGEGLVIEDDYDGEFRYDRQPVGALQNLDPDRVIHLGSVSKSLSPALRIGWLVLPPRWVDRVLRVKGPRELRTSVPEQLTLAELLDSGGYDRHVRRSRQRYRERRDRLTAALADHAPHVTVTGIAAGLHAVLGLPPGTEERVVEAGRRAGLGVTGLAFYRHPDAPGPRRDGLVVGYGAPPDHAFATALRELCAILPAP